MSIQYLTYDRKMAVAYARRWAYGRNPAFYNFDMIGGDCTNFASQCLYAGTGIMNYTKDLGWYYLSPSDRAAAWTGVEYFANFLLRPDHSPGPYALQSDYRELKPGDFIQLNITGTKYNHTLVVISVGRTPRPQNIFVAAHSYDTYGRPLSSYQFHSVRCLHILGAYQKDSQKQ